MANLQVRQYRNTLDNWELDFKHYYDFHLCKDGFKGHYLDMDTCTYAYIDPNFDETVDGDINKIYSKTIWKDANVKNVSLDDWGLCSIDNGYTIIDWDNANLEDVFKNTKLEIEDDDKRFFLKPVYGNFFTNPNITYNINIESDNSMKYINANGGFLQGFYKIHFGVNPDDSVYQTLPNRHEQVETYEFIIKPSSIQIKDKTLNAIYPENSGIFFFKGLRAENKFWYYTNQLNKKNLECLFESLEKKEIKYLKDYFDLDKLSENQSKYETLLTSENILLNTPHMVEFKSDNKHLFFNRTKSK